MCCVFQSQKTRYVAASSLLASEIRSFRPGSAQLYFVLGKRKSNFAVEMVQSIIHQQLQADRKGTHHCSYEETQI